MKKGETFPFTNTSGCLYIGGVMRTQNIKTQTETVASVKSRQVIWVDWMEKATAGLTDDSLVEVTTQHTPFGDYCMSIKPATK